MPILDNQKGNKTHGSGGRRSRRRSTDLLQKPLSTNAWQLVYTGFVLILLCFFIMLTSYASFEQAKVMQFTEAFSDAINVFSGGQSLDKGKTVLPPSTEIVSKDGRAGSVDSDVVSLDLVAIGPIAANVDPTPAVS